MITGPGPGGGPGGAPHVRIFGADATPTLSFVAFGDSSRGGVSVSAGSGLIGAGGDGRVALFSGDRPFASFDPGVTGTVTVATVAGRLAVGSAPGSASRVRVFDLDQSLFAEIGPFEPDFLGGVRVG